MKWILFEKQPIKNAPLLGAAYGHNVLLAVDGGMACFGVDGIACSLEQHVKTMIGEINLLEAIKKTKLTERWIAAFEQLLERPLQLRCVDNVGAHVCNRCQHSFESK